MELDQENGRCSKEEVEDNNNNNNNNTKSSNSTSDETEVISTEEGSWNKIPPWKKQVTARGVIASFVIGGIYSIIAMKLNLTTGLTPNLNVSAALLAFIFMRTWTKIATKFKFFDSSPFTRQENTMIQTCVVACYGIAVGGGFGSYLLGLNKKTFELTGGTSMEGNSPGSYKEPGIGWMTAYLFLACFIGLFVLIPLRKILIIDYQLTFPSGLATAVLINGFHNREEETAKKQVGGFVKFFSFSFIWGFFQWFYIGKESACGFLQFPTFGLQAYKNSFYFDFSMTYVGTGMICPHLVNLSLLLGAVLSWGIMWPLIERKEGDWFPPNTTHSSMKGLNGYKVFISVALLLGDGLYHFIKVISITLINVQHRFRLRSNLLILISRSSSRSGPANINEQLDDGGRSIITKHQHHQHSNNNKDVVFLRESIPMWVGAAGYSLFAILSSILIPLLFSEVRWYYVIIAYSLAPSLAFCNAYGAGLTDINMAYNYGKIGLFVLAAMAGKEHGGVVAGLVGCGLIKSVVNVSCILMQDLKTSHITMTSPRAMLISQAIGTAIGCLLSPLSFLLFYKAFDVGNPEGEFKAPYAVIYRNMAILGVEGFSALPTHCLQLCYGSFAFAVALNLVKDLSPPRIARWMPLPMAMAVPFLVGAYFAIDMCVGSLLVLLFHKLMNKAKAELMVPVVASGLICGEGLWSLPASILSLAKINPPMCMKFLSS
ncbi:metal-nicotianamine transporter YSL1-like [Impatiens glandulifera]|uniref:metal-nicotianamine transporter YSL1-like n=1 Tax=Impatiens glandulifera TaxID=253017 RepID=UPI001FB068C9|nr:metal-nicotianamine transporter YSL1-like [Impatiens glandulifera]XP_047333918.1 metal-nicotianamine transporter YSL1-like [Impatiens glandulifera]